MRLAPGAAAFLLLTRPETARAEGHGSGNTINVSFDSAAAECPNNPTGRSFHTETTESGCYEISFYLPVDVRRHRELALPPGYEDEMWCPPGSCDKPVTHEPGFVGPASSFHECYNEEDGTTVDEIWTGALTNETAPDGWITSPELLPCQADPIVGSVNVTTCPGDRSSLDVMSSEGFGGFTHEDRDFLCNAAQNVEDQTSPPEVLRDFVDSVQSQTVRAARLLCHWPEGLAVSYSLGDAGDEMRELDFAGEEDAPSQTRRRRDTASAKGNHGRELQGAEVSGIDPLCDEAGEYLLASDGLSRARIGPNDPPCDDEDGGRGMTVWDGETWSCRGRADDAPFYGEPNPPEWSRGDCFGKCGDGCASGGHGYMPVTADCADLDFCLRFGINSGGAPYDCADLFVAAVDDWMFADVCGALGGGGGENGCPETTVDTEVVDSSEPQVVPFTPRVMIDPWWGWGRYYNPQIDFVPFTLPGIDASDGFEDCGDLEDALFQAASYLANRAIKNNAGPETADDALLRCEPWKYYARDNEFEPSPPMMMADFAMAEDAAPGSALSGLDDSFETNVQEAGVDEADLMKATRDMIVAAYGYKLLIFNATTLDALSQLTFEYDHEADVLSEAKVDPPEVDTFSPGADANSTGKEAKEETRRGRRDLLSLAPGYPIGPYWQPPKIVALLLEAQSSNRLTVILQVYPAGKEYDDPDKPILSESTRTVMWVYDVSDPANPTLIGSRDVGGNYVSARSIGTIGHVVTSSWVDQHHHLTQFFDRCRDEFKFETANGTVYMDNTTYIKAVQDSYEDIVQSYVDRLKAELTADGACEDIVPISTFDTSGGDEATSGGDDSSSPFESEILRNFVRITSFDFAKNPPEDEELAAARVGVFVPNQDNWVYASKDVLVVPAVGNEVDPSTNRWKASTLLWAFALQDDGSAARPVGIAKVRGRTTLRGSLDQFAVDEYEGLLRVATTIDAEWGCLNGLDPVTGWCDWGRMAESTSQVTVLRLPVPDIEGTSEIMETVSVIEDLGPDEQIFAVRFMDHKAFVVTFRQTDPLYTIDLKDPEDPNPPIGELADISGFSTYLHPFDKLGNIILAVGEEVDPSTGRWQGLQISLFNVTDLKNPTLMRKYVGEGAGSDAQSDHRAFRFIPRSDDGQSGVLILPVRKYTWSEEGNYDGFTLYDVSLSEGIKPLLDVPHATNEEIYWWCWSPGAELPSRSFVIGGDLITAKERSMIKTDLETREWKVKVNMESDINTGCWYAY